MSATAKLLRQVPRLSRSWIPSGGIAATGSEDGHLKLMRAGYLRQSHSGIFQMLPLGLRVQDKIERLVVKHMEGSVGRSSPIDKLFGSNFWLTVHGPFSQLPRESHSLPFHRRPCGRRAVVSIISRPRSVSRCCPASSRHRLVTNRLPSCSNSLTAKRRASCWPRRMRRRSLPWWPGQSSRTKSFHCASTRSPESTGMSFVHATACFAGANSP